MTEVVKREFTLTELVEYKNGLAPDSEVPEEIVELYEIADNLLKGHVDKAVKLRKGLEAHIEALNKQVENVQWMLDRVEFFVDEAVQKAGGSLAGNAFSVRRQKNSQASLVVENEALVPFEYKKASASISANCGSAEELAFLFGVILGRVVEPKKDMTSEELAVNNIYYRFELTDEEKKRLDDELKLGIKTTEIKKILKDKPVPGVSLEQGFHLRYSEKSAASVKKEIEAK
jgi:hypothetical protein